MYRVLVDTVTQVIIDLGHHSQVELWSIVCSTSSCFNRISQPSSYRTTGHPVCHVIVCDHFLAASKCFLHAAFRKWDLFERIPVHTDNIACVRIGNGLGRYVISLLFLCWMPLICLLCFRRLMLPLPSSPSLSISETFVRSSSGVFREFL